MLGCLLYIIRCKNRKVKTRLSILLIALLLPLSVAFGAGKKFTLVIDAGHGGHDIGAPGSMVNEKSINLNVALAFGRYVEQACPDVRVVYTRRSDVFVPLYERADIANRAKADLFVSVHTNALPGGTEVNPYGVMYNPVSILHTIGKLSAACRLRADVAVLTLGTNHVYRLKETGEIVDNCMKRPQRLFSEELLTVDECAQALRQSVELLRKANPEVSIVLTVSPIRYRKYGYHGSQLSKATLLLAVDQVVSQGEEAPCPSALYYFPAYEIVNDELRDYRFYAPDMLHPSEQAVEYIWQKFRQACFSPEADEYLQLWRPVREALAHRPFNPESDEYKAFVEQTNKKLEVLKLRYPHLNDV